MFSSYVVTTWVINNWGHFTFKMKNLRLKIVILGYKKNTFGKCVTYRRVSYKSNFTFSLQLVKYHTKKDGLPLRNFIFEIKLFFWKSLLFKSNIFYNTFFSGYVFFLLIFIACVVRYLLNLFQLLRYFFEHYTCFKWSFVSRVSFGLFFVLNENFGITYK